MIKKIVILCFFLFMGCNQLVEKTSPLDGIYYILDGWEKFELEDYNRAQDLFSTVLLDENSEYITDAYVGLAWNSIYKANSIQGLSNFSDRAYQRGISNEYLQLAMENNNELCPPANMDACSMLCQNLLTGRIYNSSYQALESSRIFYDYGLDSSNFFDMIDYSNQTLSISDTLLNHCNPDYEFDHDPLITSDAIRILRAQTYIRLGDFDSAESELFSIEYCNPGETIFECLNIID